MYCVRISLFLLGLVFWASMPSCTLAYRQLTPTPKRIVCYYLNSNAARSEQAIRNKPTACTHLIYLFTSVDSATSTVIDQGKDAYESFLGLRNEAPQGLKLMLAVWEPPADLSKFSHLASDDDRTNTFVNSVVSILTKYGFDGLDFEWEFPTAADKDSYTKLVTALRRAFTPLGLVLSAPVSGLATVIDEGYDVPAVDKALDFFNIISSNYHNSSENVVNHKAPLFGYGIRNVNFALQHYIKSGATRSKMNLGIHFHHPSWTLSTSKTTPGSPAVEGSGADIPFSTICSNIKNGWAVVRDLNKSVGPHAFSPETKQWVAFDDVDMVTAKANYARENGIGGIHIFKIGDDDIDNTCDLGVSPLLNAIDNTLTLKMLPLRYYWLLH